MFRAKTTFFFLLLLACQSFGWQMWWHWKQASVRQQHYHSTSYEGKHLEHRTMSRSYFEQCLVDDHELRIQGEMYDIAARETKGDSVYVVLYHDFEEGHLFRKLIAYFQDNHDVTLPSRSPEAQLTRYLGQFFLAPPIPLLVERETDLACIRLHVLEAKHNIHTVSGPEPPPPRI
jgi:hypothetical protein